MVCDLGKNEHVGKGRWLAADGELAQMLASVG